MANFCAFQFWQRALKVHSQVPCTSLSLKLIVDNIMSILVMKDKQRLEYLKQLLINSGPNGKDLLLSQVEEEWCSFHKLVKSSLDQISEICMVPSVSNSQIT